MKILVESDVFDIAKRIKEIDDGYFILFDISNNRFELHNKKQSKTYCFLYPYCNLDNRLIKLIYDTNVENIDNIVYCIDKNNAKIEHDNLIKSKDLASYKFHEIYNFANNSSKELNTDVAFTNVWR